MTKIQSSVGRGGRNLDSDVVVVQTLLNRHIVPPAKLLVVDGVVGPKTISAIVEVQHRIGMHKCDGKVDPSGRTYQALLSAPKSVQVTQILPSFFDDAYTAVGKMGHAFFHVLKLDEQSRSPVVPATIPKSAPPPVLRPAGGNAIAWGAKVTPEFKKRVIEICEELDISPDYLMTCMALETAETFRSDIKNPHSSATGLIQFLTSTAKDYHTTVKDLAKMTPVEQLKYVRLYFLEYKGKLHTLEDVYMRILCPAAIGKGENAVVYKSGGKGSKSYEDNAAFDRDCDKKITVKECSKILKLKYLKGLKEGYFG